MSRPVTLPATIRVTTHPPERGQTGSPVILPCGCCCCCCCCLHSLGGIIGGIVGTTLPVAPAPRPVDPDFPFPFRRDEFDEGSPVLPMGLLYWLLVGLGILVAVAVGAWSSGHQRIRPDDLLVGAVVALIFLPAVQLAASLVALVAVLFYPDKRAAAVRLGKITLWSFVGAIIGTGAMSLCFFSLR
jgi:hypothetical protein